MPQLIVLVVAGTAAYVGYKWLKKHNQRMTQSRAPAQQASRSGPRDLGKLEWDEANSVYRPRSKTSE